ncbi:PP2C family protein-serine/threonine phosphatase [Streptomyces sp. GD-15H]|uniref:PP2C family protein-serine/threonine phosphatase n=1 Tax=Streptomyces sp. GD-15H TaxID=3129112 RepID=UPI0032465CA4
MGRGMRNGHKESNGHRESGGRKEPTERERRLRGLPAAIIAAALVLSFFTRGSLNTFPLLVAAPVVAAPLLSLRGTVATGVAANLVGLGLVLLRREPTDDELVPFTSLVILTVVAALLNVLLARDRAELRTSREVAAVLQRAVLPELPDRVGRLAVATRYEVAHREAAIGGDFFAIKETSHGIRMLIADVRGKGLEAIRTVNVLLGSFHEASYHRPDLPGVVRQLEDRMQEIISRSSGEEAESFTTAVIAELPPDHSVLRVANRGHSAPLLVHDGKVLPLEPTTPALPLGLGMLGGDEVPVDLFDLPSEATLVLYTDGINEARDADGVFFDPVPVLSRPLPPDPDTVLGTVLDAVFRHTEGRLQDDAALFAVTLDPPAPTASDTSVATALDAPLSTALDAPVSTARPRDDGSP